MNKRLNHTLLTTALSTALALPAVAATTAPGPAVPGAVEHSDRLHMPAMSQEQDALKAALKPGQPADTYQQQLTTLGYTITAINDVEPGYLEYEVVKGNNSYEVQIDIDEARGVADQVDVTGNLWRADATKAALRGEKLKVAKTAAYSDRSYLPQWRDARDALKSQLQPGHEIAYYPGKLKSLGYQVTAVNESDRDHVEYEVVKGHHSFEVQVNFADASKMAKDIDIGVNLWKADATERALKAAS